MALVRKARSDSACDLATPRVGECRPICSAVTMWRRGELEPLEELEQAFAAEVVERDSSAYYGK